MPVSPITEADRAKISTWYKNRVSRLDEVFRETECLIDELTHNVFIVLAPQVSQAIFRFLPFLSFDKQIVVVVLMSDAGFMKNKIVSIPDERVLRIFND